jgi:succinoglycan biosynthesis protein ExoL
MATIFVFGFDLGEAAQIRRIRSFRAAGHAVRSATLRRSNMNAGFVPDWPNIDLGLVENERLGRRLAVIASAVGRMARRRRALDGADLIVARNLDMLAIAWAARLLAGRTRTPLVYECLDIHGLLTRPGPVGAAARWAERRLLARTTVTLVSSPGFTREWFGRVQGHRGRVVLLENKLWFDAASPPRPTAPQRRAPDAPLTLGWVGSLRCAPSLRLLLAVAEAMGPALRLRLHGNVHRHALPDFDAAIAGRDNVTYHGPYAYPNGLAEAYRGCDLVWAQDLWQPGGNSDWLLPNRIYEASWFGCPSIAVSGSETGRRIAADGLGFVIAEPTPEALVALLRGLDPRAIRARAATLLARDDRDFCLTTAEVAAALAPALPVRAVACGGDQRAVGALR